MNVQLFRLKVTTKEGKSFFTFFLKLSSGIVTRIKVNSYKDEQGNYHDNYQVLVASSQEIKSLEEIK